MESTQKTTIFSRGEIKKMELVFSFLFLLTTGLGIMTKLFGISALYTNSFIFNYFCYYFILNILYDC